ncbi:hypothetical protein ACFW04_011383 [Cataglyphis niger]
MSKTISCVLLKVLILARADIMQRYSDSDSIQNIPVSENNNSSFATSHLDNVNERNKIGGISFANISVISESNKTILNKPTSSRAFVEFHNAFLNEEDDISVTFRWNQPKFAEEIIQGYTVQCWFIENLKDIQVCDNKSSSATVLEHVVNNLKPNTTYYFQVRALTKVGMSPYTDLIDVSTTIENPIPKLLTVSKNGIEIWDLDLKSNITEHKIYWSNNKGNLMMLDINRNNIIEVDNFRYQINNLCIDWVARNLYWIEVHHYSDDNLIKFDITKWENGVTIYDKILKIEGTDEGELTVLPSIGTLYWIGYTSEPYKIMQSDLDGRDAYYEKNLRFVCPFSFDIYISSIIDIKVDTMNTKEPLIYWLLHDLLIVTNINVSMCNLILQNIEVDIKTSFMSLTIDKTNIYISAYNHYIDSNQYYNYYHIYILKKKYALLESKDAFKYIQKIYNLSFRIKKLYAFGESFQSYPSMRCLTPDKNVYKIQIVMVTTNSTILNLPEPVPKNGCKKYNLPSTLYTIYISYCLDNKLNKFDNFTVKTYERHYEIQNLTPLAEYTLQLTLSNFYFDRLSMDPLFGSKVILKTESGKLNAPEDVTIQALTPTTAAVSWMPPKKLNCVAVIYEVYWTSIILVNNTRQTQSLIISKTERKIDNKFFTILKPLIPGQKYNIYIRVYPVNFSDFYTDSSNKILYMYSEPNNITLNEVSVSSMNISWTPSVNLTIHYELEYKNVEMQRWQIANNSEEKYKFYNAYYCKLHIITYCNFITVYRQHNKCNEQDLPPIMTNIELAILHEIPNGNVQVNMLYSPTLEYNSDEYVYRGKVKNFGESGLEIPAAIKMLRKNASPQNKKQFLEEAKIMNHFRHKHVLRLLAVCLDQESPLIVLEFMEIGDLLQYLRDNQKFQPSDSHALRLQDLFAMCEDVARGCCYLEELRFVHRDLACRNCLVSARDRENRVVKIGDFGLARDVYKDDYYRKKGQGLLPIRWMAPESLVLGIFTSQSDVWSFGVLMWEITSLGEHPYTGRTNLEVIDYVRAEGRLPMPLNCPPTLYELMLRCWNPANDRPNFKLCLKNIIALKNSVEDTLLSPIDIL